MVKIKTEKMSQEDFLASLSNKSSDKKDEIIFSMACSKFTVERFGVSLIDFIDKCVKDRFMKTYSNEEEMKKHQLEMMKIKEDIILNFIFNMIGNLPVNSNSASNELILEGVKLVLKSERDDSIIKGGKN